MANLSKMLKDQYAAALESELAGLKNAYETNAAAIPEQYETKRNAVASTNALEKQAFDERANAMGLNTGTSGQAQLAKSSVYQRDLATLNADEASALNTLKINYENEIARAKAANEAALNQALYAEMVRQEQAAAAAAAAAAKTTSSSGGGSGGSGYNNGGLSELAIKQYQTELNKLPGVNIAVDGKWGAETTAAANGMSAKEYSDKRSEIIKANASKDTSAYWTR